MRILITGGLGFIGCNLADRFVRDGADVTVFDSAQRAGSMRNLQWLTDRHPNHFRVIRGDVRDAVAVRHAVAAADVVYHLAAQVAVTHSISDPRSDFEHNALGTLNVLEAARVLSPMPTVIFTSTNKVYGGLSNVEVRESGTRYELLARPHGIDEHCPLDFQSPYGCSKGAADQYVRDYARVFGLPTVVLRLSCICGPRQFGTEDQGWLAHFIGCCLRGDPLAIYGDGKQVRDILDVGDLVELLLKVSLRIATTAGSVYNVGGSGANAVSIWWELRDHLARLAPLPDVKFGLWRQADQRVYITDIRKAVRDLDWRPTINVQDAIFRLSEWARELQGVARA